jgi:hypothetical protein
MTVLRAAVEQKKRELIECLIQADVVKMPDGRQLYELTLSELKELYEKVEEGAIK